MTPDNAKIASEILEPKGNRLLGGRIMDALDAKDHAHAEQINTIEAERDDAIIMYNRSNEENLRLRAALVEKDKAFKSITQWGFTADQRKFEDNHKKVIKMIVQIAQEALTPEAAVKAQAKDGGV